MGFKIIKKESTLEIIIHQIKEQIKKGILKPGEKLPSERKLADLLEVSRASVREAIQALAHSGYLEVIHGKGTYVSEEATKYDEIINFFQKSSDYSLDSLMEARVMLEGEFARLAALNASQDEIVAIEKIFNETENAKDLNTFVVKDLQFHLSIAEATHNYIMNGLMKIIAEMLYKETQKIIEISKDTRRNTIKTSKEMVKAIKRRDAEKAKELMGKHIRNIRLSFSGSNFGRDK